jgi:hypothetical protein
MRNLRKKLVASTSFAVIAAMAMTSASVFGGIIEIPGTSNPYLALALPGTPASNGDFAPKQSPVLVPADFWDKRDFITFDAWGAVNHGSGPLWGPDGSSLLFGRNAERGISGYGGSLNDLVGLFVNRDILGLLPPPPPLDFSKLGTKEFDDLFPKVHQLFFIGDGLNVQKIRQRFFVPAGSTHLFLGTADGYGWYNNNGSFYVNFEGTPEPGTMVIVAGTMGLAAIQAMMRKRRKSSASNEQVD